MKKRKTYSSGFKTKVVLEAIQEWESIQEISKKYDLHPHQISTWKSQFLSNANSVFEKESSGKMIKKRKQNSIKK